MNYLKTEKDLNAPGVIRVFSLESLELDQDSILNYLRSLSILLKWDEYDVILKQVQFLSEKFPHARYSLQSLLPDLYSGAATLENVLHLIRDLSEEDRFFLERISPRRKRSIAKVLLSHNHERWSITRMPSPIYKQNVGMGDMRTIERSFEEMSHFIVTNPLIENYLYSVANIVKEVHPSHVNNMEITLHRMYVVGDILKAGDNAPEGCHQDGADYIVSAMVISRRDIIGGESIICNENRDEIYFRKEIMPGEGIFQSDSGSPLWHDVTPIQYDPQTKPLDGFRDILGLDINVIN